MEDLRSTYYIKTETFTSLEYLEFLYTLYLPLIGYKAVFLYEYLNNFIRSKKESIYLEDLINETTMNTQDFFFERKMLESIGLIEFYQKDDLNYLILIKGIKSPKNFFADLIFKGLLINKIGEKKAQELMSRYKIDADLKGYKKITSSIRDNFLVEFDPSYLNVGEDIKLMSNNTGDITDNFKDSVFFKCLEEKSNINSKNITTEELKQIHDCGVVFGLDEKTMALLTIDSFDPSETKGNKVNINQLYERAKKEVLLTKSYNKRFKKAEKVNISSDTDIAKKIRYYQSISPRDLLKERQNGVEPVSSDLNIIAYLQANMGLSVAVINVILDYTLDRLNNVLDRNYIEKIAASLLRNKCDNALDALNYLYGKNKKKKEIINNNNVEKGNDGPTIIDLDKETIDEDDLDDLWKD